MGAMLGASSSASKKGKFPASGVYRLVGQSVIHGTNATNGKLKREGRGKLASFQFQAIGWQQTRLTMSHYVTDRTVDGRPGSKKVDPKVRGWKYVAGYHINEGVMSEMAREHQKLIEEHRHSRRSRESWRVF